MYLLPVFSRFQRSTVFRVSKQRTSLSLSFPLNYFPLPSFSFPSPLTLSRVSFFRFILVLASIVFGGEKKKTQTMNELHPNDSRHKKITRLLYVQLDDSSPASSNSLLLHLQRVSINLLISELRTTLTN